MAAQEAPHGHSGASRLTQSPGEPSATARSRGIAISANGLQLRGELSVPARAGGIVLFAHGSGSSRHSPRNQAVAASMRDAGLGTLLFDLLSEEEETVDRMTGHLRFDVALLARRLIAATAWIRESPDTAPLRVGYFGASTGAAAALIAAAEIPGSVHAVVSRGGRPDLAGEALPRVEAPTLLIVGGRDEGVIELNEEAHERLRCEKSLRIVPGATHLFEEPGALGAVADLAAAWFRRHLSRDEDPGSHDAVP